MKKSVFPGLKILDPSQPGDQKLYTCLSELSFSATPSLPLPTLELITPFYLAHHPCKEKEAKDLVELAEESK